MRRRRSPLLLALLGVLAAAAPAARPTRGPDPEPEAPAEKDGKEQERRAAGTKCPVFLRGAPAADRPADQDTGGCLPAPDLPPADHADDTSEPSRPPGEARPRRDDLRAGLLAIPPPAV
jgi:hypothetical protein